MRAFLGGGVNRSFLDLAEAPVTEHLAAEDLVVADLTNANLLGDLWRKNGCYQPRWRRIFWMATT